MKAMLNISGGTGRPLDKSLANTAGVFAVAGLVKAGRLVDGKLYEVIGDTGDTYQRKYVIVRDESGVAQIVDISLMVMPDEMREMKINSLGI